MTYYDNSGREHYSWNGLIVGNGPPGLLVPYHCYDNDAYLRECEDRQIGRRRRELKRGIFKLWFRCLFDVLFRGYRGFTKLFRKRKQKLINEHNESY